MLVETTQDRAVPQQQRAQVYFSAALKCMQDKSFCFRFLFISLSGPLKFSIDIVGEACIRSASVYFCEALLFKTRWQNAHHGCFLCSIKAKICIDIVSAHNKVDPLHLI